MASRRDRARTVLQSFGSWLHPTSSHRPHSPAERLLQWRAGLVGALCVVTGLGAVLIATVCAVMRSDPGVPDASAIAAGVFLVAISVFAPQAIFRARSAAVTREVLADTGTRGRTWQNSTVQFDAVLVGGMLAGLYFPVAIAFTFFGWALLARLVFTIRRELSKDSNARFHGIVMAWRTGVLALVAYGIVSAITVGTPRPPNIWPLLLAALVALYLGLAFNAIERWVNAVDVPWAFMRDAVDLHRVLVAAVAAGIAWAASAVGEALGSRFPAVDVQVGSSSLIAVFVVCWALLWVLSIQWWRKDARTALAMWRAQQTEIMSRLIDGSLSPELAARAALPTATRVAVVVFGATRALGVALMPVVDSEHGAARRTSLASLDRYDNGPSPEDRDVLVRPHVRIPLGSPDSTFGEGSVTVANWLWPGSFLVRSRGLVEEYAELAAMAIYMPVLAEHHRSEAHAFEMMFDGRHRWPTMGAFMEALQQLGARADAAPQSTSLVVGAFEIDDFGALAGGKFEQTAVAQVIRLVMSYKDFAGQDVFVAYEAPGRIWVALVGGPVIRQGIAQLRALQQWINDHGSISPSRADVDVTVSVSMGYATYQVDAFEYASLLATATHRLGTDRSTRNSLLGDGLVALDFTPEDITGIAVEGATTVDLIEALRKARGDAEPDDDGHFATYVTPFHALDLPIVTGLLVEVSWPGAPGGVDLTDPARFLALAERQLDLAVEHARLTMDAVKKVMAEADEQELGPIPIVAFVPSILLNPEAGTSALPNLVGREFDRVQASRAIFLFHSVPLGGGQAAMLLADRGMRLGLAAGAAMGVDPFDLVGWNRWGVLFPSHVVDRPGGLDALIVQQTISTVASRDTKFIAQISPMSDARALARNGITWTVNSRDAQPSVREAAANL